jgi:hypothetical protein
MRSQPASLHSQRHAVGSSSVGGPIEDGDRAVILRPTLPINLATLGSAGVPESEGISVDLKCSYITQYNVSLQQELPWDSAINLAYVCS